MSEKSVLQSVVAGIGLLSLATSIITRAESAADPLFGSAGHDQTVQLAMDEDRFDGWPDDLRAGEIVRFVVTNRSSRDHGFVVGDIDEVPITAADTHGRAAASGEHNHQLPESADAAAPLVKQVADSPSVDIPAGVTRELLVHFPRAGQFGFACPRKDHALETMSGTLKVLATEG